MQRERLIELTFSPLPHQRLGLMRLDLVAAPTQQGASYRAGDDELS
jgi:hypothetical protein